MKAYGEWCSGNLFLALPWALRKTAHFFVGIACQAEQGYPGKQYCQPAHAEDDPEHHKYKIQSRIAGLDLMGARRPLIYLAVFHYEINLLQQRDIGQRIAFYGD